MRLDDIHAYLEVKTVYDRAYFRAFGRHEEGAVSLYTAGELREAATLTDSSIHPIVGLDGEKFGLEFLYRGTRFVYYGSEVA